MPSTMLSQGDARMSSQGVECESPDSPPATLSEVLGHAQLQTQRLPQAEVWVGNGLRTIQKRPPTTTALRTPRKSPTGSSGQSRHRPTNDHSAASVNNASPAQIIPPLGSQRLPPPAYMGKFEPFDAFPVQINGSFVDLFDRYYRGYRWEPSKRKLLAETASDALLCHSFLAIAHNVYHPNQYDALNHETQTIQVVSQMLNSGQGGASSSPTSTNIPLTWAISRLAMIRAQQGDWETALRHMTACVMTCGPVPSVVNHKFGSHLLCTFMIVLLSNFIVTRAVVPSLWKPYGDPPRSILAEVEALGFKLPLVSHMSLRSQDIEPELRDILCALSALCFPVPCAAESHATHLVRQGIEMLKIGLWLAELSPLNHDALGDGVAPEWHEQLQECLRLAALLFVLSPSPMSRDATRRLRQMLTPNLLFLAIGSHGQAKAAAAALPFWILLVCGATAHDTSDQMHFAKLIVRFYPGFLDHAISGPEVPFSRLSGKFLPPTLDCLIAGIHYLNSANGWMFSPDESWPREHLKMQSTRTTFESDKAIAMSKDLRKWRRSSIGANTDSSAKYFLDLYTKITRGGPDDHTAEKASSVEVFVIEEDEEESVSVQSEDEFVSFSIDDEFLSF